MSRKFECVEECSQCCVKREYYPSKKFGKVGVLILPEERPRVEGLASKKKIGVTILPRIGLSETGADGPARILAYQMMGKDADGNTCPFLDTAGGRRSPHGGLGCMIYENRPLACRAYPVIESEPLELDSKCKFCQECGTADSNLDSELEALVKIKEKMGAGPSQVWRYATGVGEEMYKGVISKGWVRE